ncbi:hypothetical protein TNCV_4365981 [Trichonephila clavipes]|nr:hypothetical protein TNCV_4365981 [Trichonephila clavipes]
MSSNTRCSGLSDSEGIHRWPARSRDLNPIENVWDALGGKLLSKLSSDKQEHPSSVHSQRNGINCLNSCWIMFKNKLEPTFVFNSIYGIYEICESSNLHLNDSEEAEIHEIAVHCNNRIVRTHRTHLDDFLHGKIIDRLESEHAQLAAYEELGIAHRLRSELQR